MDLTELERYIAKRLEQCKDQLSRVHSLEKAEILMMTISSLESVNGLIFTNDSEEELNKKTARNFYVRKYYEKMRKKDQKSIAFFHDHEEAYFEKLYPYFDLLDPLFFDDEFFKENKLSEQEAVFLLNEFFSNYDESLQKLCKRKANDFFTLDEDPHFLEFNGCTMCDYQTMESYLVVVTGKTTPISLITFTHELMHIYDFEHGDLGGSALIEYQNNGIYREVVAYFLEDQFQKFLMKQPLYLPDSFHHEEENLSVLQQNIWLLMHYLFEDSKIFAFLDDQESLADTIRMWEQYTLGMLLGFAISDVYSSSKKEGEKLLRRFWGLRTLNDLEVPSMLGLKEEEMLSSFQRRLDNHQEQRQKIYQKSFPKRD